MDREQPELLAPAGNWECLRAAVANGADAVYFGTSRFNARMRAENFRDDELPEVVTFLHNRGVKAYVAFNVLVFSDELEDAERELHVLNDAGVDAIIVQDAGLAELARHIVPALPVHASTQMTITSPEGVCFAAGLGVKRVVLARELSLRELAHFERTSMGLEVFVHGALCVAYSGQCLTSESLGRRSANRGECAQACRMPYALIVDGERRDLGDKSYLLSPQDLAAVNEIPRLLELGVTSFKIEGRLKSPEYVAAVTSVYRKALDAAMAARSFEGSAEDWYRLEMTFSRGLYTGWLHGVNHQELVSARYGKKRGPLVGIIAHVGRDHVRLTPAADRTSSIASLKRGDGVVFDTGGDTDAEQGGRVYAIDGNRLEFERGKIDFSKLKPGDRVWKTDDPALDRALRSTFSGRIAPHDATKQAIHFTVQGTVGAALVLTATAGGASVTVASNRPLQAAINQPLTNERLCAQLGRLDESRYRFAGLENRLAGSVILPIGEINRLRREAIYKLDELRRASRQPSGLTLSGVMDSMLRSADRRPEPSPGGGDTPCESEAACSYPVSRLSVLCRSEEQLISAIQGRADRIYIDFEDVRRYRHAVATVREQTNVPIFVATPRILKPREQGFFKLIEAASPDGILIRNVGAVAYFRGSPLHKVGDFSLNVANPLTASLFIERGLERLTISYDLNIAQVLALLATAPPQWFELTIHQHMPMFHMEHCVFAAFLSNGTDYTNCGRPCEAHRVHLLDRAGIAHPLRADAGCRNTLFNAVAQTGAPFFDQLRCAGLRDYRLELLEEGVDESRRIIAAYRALLDGRANGYALWGDLKAQSQLGVTRGTYT